MTLSFGGEIRYTANAKSSAFYLPDVLMLWHLYHPRCLNNAKNPPKHSPANNGWPPVFAASNNSMHPHAQTHDTDHHEHLSAAFPPALLFPCLFASLLIILAFCVR